MEEGYLERIYAGTADLKDFLKTGRLDVIDDIHPTDGMYQKEQADYYFKCGLNALENIRLAMEAVGRRPADIKNILDFACGYGRVLRMLKAGFPLSGITACDLDKKAVDFCSNAFKVKPVYADKDVSRIELKEKYDLIWVGSLLTHLAPGAWPGYISFFESVLSPGGILMFTMHGRYVAQRFITGTKTYGIDKAGVEKLLDEYKRSGSGFAEYTPGTAYGISVADPSSVMSNLESMTGLRVLIYNEKGWVKHQDVVGVVKENIY